MNNKTTERLLAATQDIWEGYLNHPFVHGIADRFYLLQDYVYLFDYAKVFAQGVVKSREIMNLGGEYSRRRDFTFYMDSRHHRGGRRARQAIAE